MEMVGYFFNEELFRKLHTALEMPIAKVLDGTGIPETTWRTWRRTQDMPLAALIKLCNVRRLPIAHFICAGSQDTILVGARHYLKKSGEYANAVFLNSDFGFEITTMQDRNVTELCKLAGMSTFTFYRYFRNEEGHGDSFGFKAFLSICNKTKTYPMDFLICNEVNVPILKGYTRRHEVNTQMLTVKSRGTMAQYAKMKTELRQEREKVKKLEAEVERLKRALYSRQSESENWVGKASEEVTVKG